MGNSTGYNCHFFWVPFVRFFSTPKSRKLKHYFPHYCLSSLPPPPPPPSSNPTVNNFKSIWDSIKNSEFLDSSRGLSNCFAWNFMVTVQSYRNHGVRYWKSEGMKWIFDQNCLYFGNKIMFLLVKMLKMLDLRENKVQLLPATIGRLGRLSVCLLSNNHLKNLCMEIGQCIELTRLELQYNELTELPDSIGNLRKLISLGLK